jgi:hypothetical protein
MTRVFTTLMCCWLATAASAQSPFARSRAGFYAQLGWHTLPRYEVIFDKNGDALPLKRSVSEHTFQLYGEYGLTRKTTGWLSIPLRLARRSTPNPSTMAPELTQAGQLTGLGNASLGIRHQFLSEKIALAASLRVDLPATPGDTATGLAAGYRAVTALPMFSVGQGFRRGYWSAHGGYGYRSNQFSHFTDASIEGGVHLGDVWLIGFSQALLSLKNGSRGERPIDYDAYTGLFVDRQAWVSVGVKSLWQVTRFTGLVASVAGAPYARNAPKSLGVSVAAFFRWD